ncbi:MAG: hypothetical protein ABI685_14125 [Ferruginibacter sp.]
MLQIIFFQNSRCSCRNFYQNNYLPVYDMAVEVISHSDGQINLTNLTSFITAYQTYTALKIGELWALPIMLRLALLENLPLHKVGRYYREQQMGRDNC